MSTALDRLTVQSRALVGIYDGAEVEHHQSGVTLTIHLRTGKNDRERVVFEFSKSAFEDVQYVMDRGPLLAKQRSLWQIRKHRGGA